ncbi:thioredoxin domain-containing protein [Psychroserpens sp. SPM9]|uniref:vitamin K epoxide reductase family protein n=1 Tax=Psychroserpens sp. SPM9 TaxID=2975598 RepID=UPI0021A41773|nr:vitamin K epoxide reductase family protein [Psychroserpens sp. SPM9]
MKDALSYLVQQLLKKNKINVDFDELAFQIQSHPTYPSLHAITGVLDHFNIENLAIDVPKTNEVVQQLPNTFLAQIDIDSQKQFAIVTKLKDRLKLILNSKDKKVLSQSEFLNQFTGIVLAVDKEDTQLNTPTSHVKSIVVKSAFVLSILLIGFLFLKTNPNLISTLFFLLSLIGLYVTTNIIKQERGEVSVLGDAFCATVTEKKNCNAVLSSKGATIIKDVKLSDLSLIYFTALALSTFLLSLNNNTIFIPKLIGLLALPITLFSLYYQVAVIKKWCYLCLAIVGIIWIQAGLSLTHFTPNYELTSILITSLSFTSITAFWLLESQTRKDNKSLQQTKVSYFKFKRNFEIFSDQLLKSKVIDTHINDLSEIVFGNPKSNLNITIITNPLCGHCKQVHTLLEQIIHRYPQSAKLTVRFNINPKDPEAITTKITSRLLEIYNNDGELTCLKAMHDIYGDFSTEAWLTKWHQCTEPQTYISILQEEYSWCMKHAINFTPELLINGQSYPKAFDRDDLIYFIEDLQEQLENTEQHSMLKI